MPIEEAVAHTMLRRVRAGGYRDLAIPKPQDSPPRDLRAADLGEPIRRLKRLTNKYSPESKAKAELRYQLKSDLRDYDQKQINSEVDRTYRAVRPRPEDKGIGDYVLNWLLGKGR